MFAELAAYMFFIFNPPKSFIFENPISHKYGLLGHTEMHKHKGETSSYAAENNVKTKKKSICKENRKANPNCLFCEGCLIK